ncbi:MAG: PilN domain-containing protein, partial [Thermoanaerobaculia bacterium]|nr:PilN domain-containing protein [Thermoanaerobaculia bacterium]
MIKINLLAEGKRPVVARRARPSLAGAGGGPELANLALVIGLVLGLLVAGGWWFLLSQKIKQRDREIAVAQKEVDELAQVIKEVEEYKAKKAELERKIEVINTLKDNQRGPVQIMDEVSRALPELLWLANMDVTATAINLRGAAFNMSAVANFMDNLDDVEQFAEPILQDATQRAQAAGARSDIYDFRLNLGYSFTKPKADAGG